jgi:uncharacterized protein YbbC (DUF1343 family)
MEACSDAGIPVWILDRPNPIARLPFDGPVLKEEYFTFVGGASIPLCHRMTLGEIALWIKGMYFNKCDLNIVWMKNWKRNSLFSETGLPWILPSPNMPTLQTAFVYPGMVLAEALNVSELHLSTRKVLRRILMKGILRDAFSGSITLFQHSISFPARFVMVCRSMLLNRQFIIP